MAGQFISLIKDASLASVIALTDLTKAGREIITSAFSTFEIMFTVAGMYLVLTFSLSMVCVIHEMGFAREVADRVVFMDEGEIVEVGAPMHFFENSEHPRTKRFLEQIL